MWNRTSHLSDHQLLRELDGELSAHDTKQVASHLGECWECRTRRRELESAIGDFVRAHRRELETKLPSAAGPRALLKAQLAQLSTTEPKLDSTWLALRRGFGWALVVAACSLLFLGWRVLRSTAGPQNRQAVIISIPDSRLTPGAAVLESRQAVCTGENTKNKAVSVALQRKVFDEYGITGARLAEYEVDYLITPALGGADDIHNLWPQSYSTNWNATVKDALEDHLRELVCNGKMDLQEAQQEIATDWIAAYKKHFHTDKPLPEHR